MSRTGIGEWQFDVRQEIIALSNEFITSIRTIAPKVLEDLSGVPFDSFHSAQLDSVDLPEMFSVWNEVSSYKVTVGNPLFLKYSRLTDPLLLRLCEDLSAWSEKWHLNADWCRKWAFGTLWWWGKFPDRRERLVPQLLQVGYSRTRPDAQSGTGLPQWHTGIQTKKGYLQEVKQAVEDRVAADPMLSLAEASFRNSFTDSIVDKAKAYCAEVEREIEKHERRAKRVGVAPALEDHMAWTVRVWVLNENFSHVARSVGKTRPAVRKAVVQILSIIEPSWAKELKDRFPAGRPKEG